MTIEPTWFKSSI